MNRVVKYYLNILILLICFSLFNNTAHYAFADYEVIDIKSSGKIHGKVLFTGPLPDNAVEQVVIANNPEVCGDGYRNVVKIKKKNGALNETFIYIANINKGKAWKKPDGGQYILDQKKCRFIPGAQIIKPGPITFINSDAGVLHNINMRELIGVEKGRILKRTMFNFAQSDINKITTVIKTRRSIYLSVTCQSHSFMHGYILAPEHPYATVTDSDGIFSIDRVPSGEYTVKAWHPHLGVKKTIITVPANGTVELNFEFTK